MASCEKADIEGIILSKPLYDNTLDLYEVIKLIDAYPYIGDFYSREDICQYSDTLLFDSGKKQSDKFS